MIMVIMMIRNQIHRKHIWDLIDLLMTSHYFCIIEKYHLMELKPFDKFDAHSHHGYMKF